MSSTDTFRVASQRLRELLLSSSRGNDKAWQELVETRDSVLARYGPLFTPSGIDSMTQEEVRGFLMFRNNHHWSGLQRLAPDIVKDLPALRKAIKELVDEGTPINLRLDGLLPAGKARVKRLGKAVLTPILLITYPDRYGVWNGTSEGAMRELGIWPDFDRGVSVGTRYLRMNQILLDLARELSIDLWTLDALWWRILRPSEGTPPTEDEEEQASEADAPESRFGLERHLHEFLGDNWEHTELGKDWELDQEGGDTQGYGYERITPIGTIDLLARHKRERRWLVIELKRAQATDQTVGQVLRYMGWVGEVLAKGGETVEGLIIAHGDDEKLRYALKPITGVGFMRYRVDFHLEAARR